MSKDFLKKYKKNKTIGNITIIITSLIIALSINFLIIDNSDFGLNLKTSVLESNQNTNKADLYLVRNNNILNLINSKILNNTKSLSYSIVFNPENVEIKNITCDNSEQILKIENNPGIKAFIINYKDSINIKPKTEICKIETIKKENKSEQLNMINSNFTDNTGETFLLNTSGITF